MWRVGEKLVFGGSQSRVFEMAYRPLMSAAYWGQVWSWIQFSFVCVCIGDVWGCYQSRHRCCDLRPSSSLRHGGQVYLKFPLQRDKRMCACMCEDKEELFILPVSLSCDNDTPALLIAATMGRHFCLSFLQHTDVSSAPGFPSHSTLNNFQYSRKMHGNVDHCFAYLLFNGIILTYYDNYSDEYSM